MKLIKTLAFIAVFIFIEFNSLFAQQGKTAYEKRVEQVENEAARKMGYSTYNDIVTMALLEGSVNATSFRNTKKA